MNIIDVFRGIKFIAFDTSPFIYYTEQHPLYIERMDAIFDHIYANDILIAVSMITLAEVLVKPLKVGDTVVADKYRLLLSSTGNIHLVSVNRAIAERAAILRAGYNLKMPDALQIATAIEAGCDAFLTNDVGVKRVTEIPILVLDELAHTL